MWGLLLTLSIAWASGEKDIVGKYKADVEDKAKQSSIDLRLSHKFTAKYDKKQISGSWTNKGSKITLKSPKGTCSYTFTEDLSYNGGERTGPGLTGGTSKLPFCPHSLYKD